MCSTSTSCLFLPTYTSFFLVRHHHHRRPTSLYKPRSPTLCRLSSDQSFHLQWLQTNPDHFAGWGPLSTPPPAPSKSLGLPTLLIRTVGASVAVSVAAVACFSLTRKGFEFRFTNPLHVLHGIWSPADNETIDNGALGEDTTSKMSEAVPVSDGKSLVSASEEKVERVLIPVALDSTQQEALRVLKKLKIIEDDVKADELCTRREYAKWLVRINSSFERNAKHRLVSAVSLSGSIVAAFADVSVNDPDFGSIQALAEAGVIPSKLSPKSSHGNNYFFPERFISRQDLIDWKAHLEYDFSPGIIDQISTAVGFMDVKEISPDASARLYTDMLAGEKSILRKVFGQCKRLQPNKPSTKAQAAVALTSGRISKAISSELLRLKEESSATKAEMEIIRFALLDNEDIRKFWDEKLNAEKIYGLEVEKAYHDALIVLEEEKIVQEKHYAGLLKEKAAMDCQRQLLFDLQEEINEMSEKLSSERTAYVADKSSMQHVLSDLETKQESMLAQKLILESEIEAVRILKSWIEDEAKKSQARAKVLEEVGRRWKWEDQAS